MRVVFDANVLASAFGWPSGRCAQIVRLCLGEETVIAGDALAVELADTLREKAAFYEPLIQQDIGLLKERSIWLEPASVEAGACRDPDDLYVLGLALAGRADYVVTGDKDLLVLKEFRGIRILTPAGFLDLLQGRRDTE